MLQLTNVGNYFFAKYQAGRDKPCPFSRAVSAGERAHNSSRIDGSHNE